MAKKLFEVLGKGLEYQNKLDKKFADIHTVDKVRGKSEPTDDNKLFNASNIKPAERPGKSGSGKDPMIKAMKVEEGAMDVYRSIGGMPQDNPDDEDAQRNQAIQDNMEASRQYKQQGAGHTQLASNHSQMASDMNQDSKLRNMHRSIADLQTQLSNSYGKLSKYHDGQMQTAISSGGGN